MEPVPFEPSEPPEGLQTDTTVLPPLPEPSRRTETERSVVR